MAVSAYFWSGSPCVGGTLSGCGSCICDPALALCSFVVVSRLCVFCVLCPAGVVALSLSQAHPGAVLAAVRSIASANAE